MKKQNLKKCISLIGPSSVGKSLLSDELAKRLNYKHFSIDDLIVMVRSEMDGDIGPTKYHQNEFFEKCIKDMQDDKDYAYLLKSKKYAMKEWALVYDFIKLYNYYRNLLGNFKPLYKIIKKYNLMVGEYRKPVEYINALTLTTAEIMKYALKMIDEPLIIDFPAAVGWKTEEVGIPTYLKDELEQNSFKIDVEKDKEIINIILSESTTVFIHPGMDYGKRNAERRSEANQEILRQVEEYAEQAKIEISVNGLFNNPTHPMFQKRSWFDAKEYIIKEKLKNKGEIANVCDQILFCREELNSNKDNMSRI